MVLLIHWLNADTFVYTPGKRSRAHPFPHDTIPTRNPAESSIGPPESPWHEVSLSPPHKSSNPQSQALLGRNTNGWKHNYIKDP